MKVRYGEVMPWPAQEIWRLQPGRGSPWPADNTGVRVPYRGWRESGRVKPALCDGGSWPSDSARAARRLRSKESSLPAASSAASSSARGVR